MKAIFLLATLFSLSLCASITGSDDRHEVMDAPLEVIEISDSVAALVRRENLKYLGDGRVQLTGLNYVSDLGFCKNSRFVTSQRLVANCSASLIGEDLLLTAGHCVEFGGKLNLSEFVAVFDYKVSRVGQSEFIVDESSLYNLVSAPLFDFDFPGDNDVAILKLDRKVKGREILSIDFDRKTIQEGKEIFMLGFPFGLPMKYTDNGFVTKTSGVFSTSKDSFVSDLDSFSVNSGSSVFDRESKKIVGVLVRGSGANYEKDSKRNCHDWGGLVKEAEYFSEINYIDLISKFFLKEL